MINIMSLTWNCSNIGIFIIKILSNSLFIINETLSGLDSIQIKRIMNHFHESSSQFDWSWSEDENKVLLLNNLLPKKYVIRFQDFSVNFPWTQIFFRLYWHLNSKSIRWTSRKLNMDYWHYQNSYHVNFQILWKFLFYSI